MILRLATSVWGGWHLDVLRRATIPTLLAPGNLPKVGHRVVWRIRTTPNGAGTLEACDAIAEARRHCAVEVVASCAEESPPSHDHLRWWHLELAEARASGQALVTLHPDCAWSDGSIAAIAAAFDAGKLAVFVPNVRVVAEDFVSALGALGTAATRALSGRTLMSACAPHLHPLFWATDVDRPFHRPTTEAVIGAGAAGFVMVQGTRPAIAVAPSVAEVGPTFFLPGLRDIERVHVATSCDDMLMLSLAPRHKDIALVRPGRSLRPVDIAVWSAHATSVQPLSIGMAERPVALRFSGDADGEWADAMARARDFGRRVINARLWIEFARSQASPARVGEIARGLYAGDLDSAPPPG